MLKTGSKSVQKWRRYNWLLLTRYTWLNSDHFIGANGQFPSRRPRPTCLCRIVPCRLSSLCICLSREYVRSIPYNSRIKSCRV